MTIFYGRLGDDADDHEMIVLTCFPFQRNWSKICISPTIPWLKRIDYAGQELTTAAAGGVNTVGPLGTSC